MDYCNSVKLLLGLAIHILVQLTVAASYVDIGDIESSPRTGYACEGSTLTIQCAEDMRIRILRANYGRFSKAVCNDGRDVEGWDAQCMSTRSLRIVTDMCENRTACSVMASNNVFGDTCATTYKYLEIEYICEPVPPVQSTTSAFDPPYPIQRTSTSPGDDQGRSTTPTVSTADVKAVSTSTSSTSSRPVLPTQAVGFCAARLARRIEWPRTSAGMTAVVECPNNKDIREAKWHCSSYPVAWAGRPDLSRCVSDAVLDIHGMLQDSSESYTAEKLESVADDLSSVPMTVDNVTFGGDIVAITSAMKEAVSQIEEHVHDVEVASVTPSEMTSVGVAHKVNDAVLRTSSFLLNENKTESWMDLPQATQTETATRLLSTVEDSAYQMARTYNEPKTIVNITLNIVVEVNVVDTSDDRRVDDVTFPRPDLTRRSSLTAGGNTIRLTGDTIRQLGADGLAKIIFATYSNLEQYLHPQSDDADAVNDLEYKRESASRRQYSTTDRGYIQWQPDDRIYYNRDSDGERTREEPKVVGTNIISASVGDRREERKRLKEPVIYTLEHKSDINVYNPTCSFWEYSEKTMSGQWSTFGCKLVETNVTHTTCACEHLTNFAVLMTVVPASVSRVHEFSLSMITYFGCILSIVCLAVAFVTFFAFKNLQGDRNTIHKNLVASLFVAEVVFLVGIMQTHQPILCSVIAGVLHFVFLVAFAWMCLEGIQLYMMLVEVFEVERSRIRWYYAAGYGGPAVIVALSAAVYPSGYGTSRHCWLSTERGFIWAFVGPVCAIICVNIVMLSVAMFIMYRHAASAASSWKMKEKGRLENIRSWIKGAVVLIVLLGPTWAFGLFYVNTESIIMAYLFTILNSLQGVFIFVFHCLMNEKTVKEYKRWVRHASWLPSNLRMRCGGNKATPSTTPNNSTTSGVNRVMTDQRLSLEYLTRLLSNRRKRLSTTTLQSTNTAKRNGGYNKIQRHSSGHDSGHLTDSGIACCNDDSHIYSEPTTEDPSAYLDPVRIRLDPDEELYWPGGEMSVMEGSVADTDYLDNFGRRGPQSASPSAAQAINIDKYKIRPPPPSFPPPLVPPSAEPEDASVMEEGDDDEESCQRSPSPDHEPSVSSVYSSDESLVRRKLLALGEGEVASSLQSSASMLMNNLNKCSSDTSLARDNSGLSVPNIIPTPPVPAAQPLGLVNRAIMASLQHSLPTLSTQANSTHHPVAETRPRHSLVYSSVDARLNSISR